MRWLVITAVFGAAVLDAPQKARFDHDMTEGRAKFASGMTTRSVKDLAVAIDDFDDALKLDPSNVEANDKRDEALAKRTEILNLVASAAAAEKSEQAEAMFQNAMSAKSQRRYEQAVDEFQAVVSYDPSNGTGYASQAAEQIAWIKGQLALQAAPFRAQGREAMQRQDYVAACKAYRQAIRIDPYDQTLVEELEPIQAQVTLQAAAIIRAAESAGLSFDQIREAERILNDDQVVDFDTRRIGDFGAPDERRTPLLDRQ